MFQPQSKGASYHKLWENLWGVNYTYFNIILLAKYAFSYKPLDYATPFHYPGKMDVNATCGFIAYRLELFYWSGAVKGLVLIQHIHPYAHSHTAQAAMQGADLEQRMGLLWFCSHPGCAQPEQKQVQSKSEWEALCLGETKSPWGVR